MVVVVGRRRRATYGRIAIAAKGSKKDTCTIPANMAVNLRLRQDDTLKIVPLGEKEEEGERSGDLLLITKSKPASVASATFSPIEDSLAALKSSESGDEISDEEIMDRFVKPYTGDESGAFLKKGSNLILRDDNGKSLEFIVTHVDLDDGAVADDDSPGKKLNRIVIRCALKSGLFSNVLLSTVSRKQ